MSLQDRTKTLILGALGDEDSKDDIVDSIESGSGSITFSSREIYVDVTSGNDSSSGGPVSPLKTISAAMLKIGSATSSTDFNDASTAYWTVKVAPGVYTEDVVVPTRQIIELDLSVAQIVGNVSQTIDTTLITGNIAYTKLIIKGSDLRPAYTGSHIPLTGINGNLTITSSGVNLKTVQIINSGVTGNVTFDGDFPSALFLENAMIVGTIFQTTFGGQITLYASNSDTSGSKSIGGIDGQVVLNILRNVRFAGPVISQNVIGGRWFNVDFKNSASNDFTSSTGTVTADANSITSFLANVLISQRGAFAFSYADQTQGIGYTPGASGDWQAPAPTTTQSALDRIASLLKTLNSGSPIP